MSVFNTISKTSVIFLSFIICATIACKEKSDSSSTANTPTAVPSAEELQTQYGNQLGVGVRVEGQSGSNFTFNAGDAVNLQFIIETNGYRSADNLLVALTYDAPSYSSLTADASNKLVQNFNWPNSIAGVVPVTLVVRDLSKCAEYDIQDCNFEVSNGIAINNFQAYEECDALFQYTISVQGTWSSTGTGLLGGTTDSITLGDEERGFFQRIYDNWFGGETDPYYPDTENQGFFMNLWDNISSWPGAAWDWIVGLFGG
jgi:hypothetical protein